MIPVLKADAADSALVQAAESMEPRLRNAFLAAVDAVKDQVKLQAIADAVQSRDASRVISLLDLETAFRGALGGVGLAAGVESVRDAIQATFAAGARVALSQLPSRVSISTSFDLLNPESVRFLERYAFDLIRQVSSDTRAAIQQTVLRAFQEGGHPYEQARAIKQMIGLTPRMEQAVTNYRNALESGSSTGLREALARSLRDGRYDRSLISALKENRGLPQERIDAMVERYRQRYLQYRARNIARTETIRASSQGQRELWRQAREQGLIPRTALRTWVVSGDERTCSVCTSLDGQEVGLDEPFIDEDGNSWMDPPDPHPSCRCSTSLIASSLREAA